MRQALHQTERSDQGDTDASEVAETAVAEAKLQRLKGFKKVPDTPLGVVVRHKKERRAADHGTKKRRASRR